MYNNSHLNITEESLDGKSYRRNSQTSTYIREQLNHIQTLHDKTIEEDEENLQYTASQQWNYLSFADEKQD
jgi:hypothetical protein